MSEGKFLQETVRFIREHQLVESGGKVLVAVSGGLDSTVLVDAMVRVARLFEIQIEVAHLDHRTRGVASEREASWVQVLAGRLGVPFHAVRLATDESRSQSEMRELRRTALQRVAEDVGADRIATAHHADDNAETFLMRAMSGTGSRGLSGIPPRQGIWIKPLLWTSRQELEAYARARRLGWVEDPSNARKEYLRNRLRLEALPLLETIRPGSVKNMARAAERLEEEEQELATWLGAQLTEWSTLLPLGWIERWPRPLRRRALSLWLKRLGIEHDPLLVESLARGDEVIHPAGSFLRRSDSLIYSPESEFGELWAQPLPIEVSKRLPLGASMAWSFLANSPVRVQLVDMALFLVFREPGTATKGAARLALSWTRSPWPLVVRRRRPSDGIDGELRRAGIPKPYWSHWPVLAEARNLDVWVAIVGVAVKEEHRADGKERCVFMEAFFEERLNALSQSC